MKAALQNYQDRMQRVLDYIDQHLDGDLDLETVSRVAAFSKFHFHRQFTATFELSVHRYVQLARMRTGSSVRSIVSFFLVSSAGAFSSDESTGSISSSSSF